MSLYIDFLDIEYDGLDGRYLDVMNLNCEQHGLIESWPYDAVIPWSDLNQVAYQHLNTMHFGWTHNEIK